MRREEMRLESERFSSKCEPRRQRDQRRSGKNCGQAAEWIGVPARSERQRSQKQGQQQIEVLLDRERPTVREQRRAIVLHKEHFRQQGAAGDRLPAPRGDRDRHCKKDIKGRVNLEAAPDQKSPDIQRPVPRVFLEQKTRHQEPAQDEKQIDTDPSRPLPERENRRSQRIAHSAGNLRHVPAEHEHHRDRAQDIEDNYSLRRRRALHLDLRKPLPS